MQEIPPVDDEVAGLVPAPGGVADVCPLREGAQGPNSPRDDLELLEHQPWGLEHDAAAISRPGHRRAPLGARQRASGGRVEAAEPELLFPLLEPGEDELAAVLGKTSEVGVDELDARREGDVDERRASDAARSRGAACQHLDCGRGHGEGRDRHRRPHPAEAAERQRASRRALAHPADRRAGERLEGEGEVARGLETVLRALLEAVQHEALERCGERRGEIGQGRWVLPQDGGQGLGHGVPDERPLPAQHFVEHAAQGEEVGARVRPLSHRLLRGHVAGGSQHRARVRAPRLGLQARLVLGRRLQVGGQAEVEDLDPPVRRDEEVRRLEVPVDDALVVRRREAARDLGGVLDRPPLGQRPSREPLPEGPPLEQFRHGVGRAVVHAEVVDGEDARVGERGEGLRLVLEAGQPVRIPGEALGQDLDGNGAVEAGVPRPVDLAHPPRA